MRNYWAILTLLVAVAAGCIVGDEVTTLTIHSDGSADVVVFRSNLHSTQKGSEGQRELAEYRIAFDKQEGEEFDRIRRAGGILTRSSWISDAPPFSNFLQARLGTADALEKYFLTQSDDGQPQISAQFVTEGQQRRLVISVRVSPDDVSKLDGSASDVRQLRQEVANGISETRIAVTAGMISGARGFAVAEDGQSALLNVDEAIRLLKADRGHSEFWVQWTVE